jgi:hypothetical protein
MTPRKDPVLVLKVYFLSFDGFFYRFAPLGSAQLLEIWSLFGFSFVSGFESLELDLNWV